MDSSSYGQLTRTRNPVDFSVLSIEYMGLSLSWDASQEIPLTDKTRLVLSGSAREKCRLKIKIFCIMEYVGLNIWGHEMSL